MKSAEKVDGDGKVSKAELSRFNREYLESRNRGQAAKAAGAQRRGELISERWAQSRLAYLLIIFRQRTLLAPTAIAHRLVSLGFVEPAKEHSASEAIEEDIHALLTELAELPAKVTDPDWLQRVTGDGEEPQEQRETPLGPEQVRAQTEKATRRRKQKTAQMRKARAEGRA